MYQILRKQQLNPTVTLMEIKAPLVARKAEAGQFIILRVDEQGERIPLTIAGYHREEGWVRIIFQIVGATTAALNEKNEGDSICDFVGPLGCPTKLDGLRRVCIVGGGVGCAIALPVAEALRARGASVTSIIGFRSKDLVILEDAFAAVSDTLHVMTDDGSWGRQGNVCVPLSEMLARGEVFDEIITIGPLVMMKFVVETARPTKIPCTVSMNPIMIDGTGMCGGCRLTLRGEDGAPQTKFACVDGPDFDGYAVDFDEAMMRGGMYRAFERHAYETTCSLFQKEVH
ncbi:MAG: sulfide/dihydroorotate dehydrogenase-like FAD/NAD-binding protein [Clostridia bacterium]|nr:sulfide/dihydroorotate dehydrogenase-like FAD/NAD-binding protein [Clostridia bacterium]